jgi:putative thioredoxin
MPSFAKDVDAATFDQAVLEESKRAPVVVDFWAPWCGPCRALQPVLEKLVGEYQGRFVLAKVNADANPELAAQFNVRSIPAVKGFVDGQLKDEFLGALPESAVRAFIDGLMPSQADRLRHAAAQARARGDDDAAVDLLKEAAQLEPRNEAVSADRLELLLDLARLEEARGVAAQLGPLAAQDRRTSRALARLELASGPSTESEAALRAKLDANQADLDARLALAKRLANEQRYEAALEELLEIIRRDRKWNDEAGRKIMLSIFEVLGGQGELVNTYRRRLASALH